MGSLDQTPGANVKRKIKIVNVTGLTPAQIETEFNNNWGSKGWRVVQVFTVGANTFMLAERQE
jgi:hypothetical protein